MQTQISTGDRRRWFALVVVCFAMLMNTLDQTIVNVALPTIQRDLGFTQASLAWVIDAYLVTFGGALLLAGRLGDLVGRRRIFLAGVALFTLASAACGLAGDQTILVAARFVQGLGAALSSSVIVAIIVAEFPEAAERARAMSTYVLVAVGGSAIGLLAGGVLTQALSWHWIFFINLPIGALTFVLGWVLIADNAGLGLRAGLDVGGALLSTAGLTVGVYAIVTASDHGWGSAHTLAFGAVALALLGLFWALEGRLAHPLMPLHIFRVRGLASTSLVRGLAFVGLYSLFFIGVLYLQHVLGYGPVRTGLAFLPLSLSVMVMSLAVTPRLMRWLHPKPTVLVGLALMMVGVGLFTRIGFGTSYAPLLVGGFLLAGVGGAAAITPLLTIAVSEVPAGDAGLGSGVVNAAQQLAGAIGVAVLGTVADRRVTALLAAGHSQATALLGAYRTSFGLGVACVAAGLLLAAVVLRGRPTPAPAQAVDDAASLEADQAPVAAGTSPS